MEFDEDSDETPRFIVDAADLEGNFIARPIGVAAEKADEILNNTLARLKRQDKGPSEKAYLVTLKRKFGELFKLGYGLISTKCKHDDLGRHVYEPQPIEGQASKCAVL
jgi:hypothetical protein